MCTIVVELKIKDLKPLLEHVFCDWRATIYLYSTIAVSVVREEESEDDRFWREKKRE